MRSRPDCPPAPEPGSGLPRIVSLVPGATEMLVALGAAGQLVGRSSECDHPASIQRVPTVTADAMPSGLSSVGIDAHVAAGGATSGLALERLERLEPDVVIGQELCGACAPSAPAIADALGPRTAVLSLSPHRLDEVLATAELIGDVAGRAAAGRRLTARLRARVEAAREAAERQPLYRAVCLEWLSPLYRAGHWIPDQVAAAGGLDPLGRAGLPAIRMTIDDVRSAGPEAVVLMPCGWSADEALARAGDEGVLSLIRALPGPPAVIAAADAHFSRPGPRLVDGIEWLARALHRPRQGSALAPLR